MLEDKKPETKPIKDEKQITLNDISMENSPEYMCIEDNYIGKIKPEKIEEKEKNEFEF